MSENKGRNDANASMRNLSEAFQRKKTKTMQTPAICSCISCKNYLLLTLASAQKELILSRAKFGSTRNLSYPILFTCCMSIMPFTARTTDMLPSISGRQAAFLPANRLATFSDDQVSAFLGDPASKFDSFERIVMACCLDLNCHKVGAK